MTKEFAPVPEGESAPGSARTCVLLVEDDERLLRALTRVLEFDGFAVLCAADARSAHAHAREHGSAINVIVTDMILPDQPASELGRALARECPGAPILFMSGAPTNAATLPVLGVPTQFLPKPFSPQELRTALRVLRAV